MKTTYTLFEKLVSEVNAAIVKASAPGYEYDGAFETFRIAKTMYKIRSTKENLTSFLKKITLKRRFMTDAIFAAPAVSYVEKQHSREDEYCYKNYFMSYKDWRDLELYRAKVNSTTARDLQKFDETGEPLAAIVDEHISPRPAKKTTAKPANTPKKSNWESNLTKSVQCMIRQRRRHLQSFKAGQLSEKLAVKYEKLGLIDLATCEITKRGMFLAA